MNISEVIVGRHVVTELRVADEVWIATALLHCEDPDAQDFTVEDIVERARQEALRTPLRPGVYVHAVQHCVANRPPNPASYRMLFETRPGRRRLFRNGDPYDPRREGKKITPEREDLPSGYAHLLDWYRDWSAATPRNSSEEDPLLAMQRSGRLLWADEHADDYVRRLREGWE